jgi:phosphohistidine phosphatase
MKTLLIMRHAKSSWDNVYLADHERPLNGRGKNDAKRMGLLLRQEALLPDLIISSSAKRALSTAERVVLASEYPDEVIVTRQFYHADPEDYRLVLQKLDDAIGTVLIVGHNPGMAELLSDLCGVDDQFTTANIAHVELLLDSWKEFDEETEGTLRSLWRPKELN